MAGCKPSDRQTQRKCVSVPEAMTTGHHFVRWDEDSFVTTPVMLHVDSSGFYLRIVYRNKGVELVDVHTISDTRTGCHAKSPKDPRLRESLVSLLQLPDTVSLEDCTLTVCCAVDFVNVSFINFCCTCPATTTLWCDSLLSMAYNMMSRNASVTNSLLKTHTRITAHRDANDKIAVKTIIKSFASHKEDKKRVEKALEWCGLPCIKTESIDVSQLSFEVFVAFYMHLVGRQEVHKIFDELCDSVGGAGSAGAGSSSGSSSGSCSGSGGGSQRKRGHLHRLQLVEFLNLQQRDPRLNEILFPYTDEQRAMELIGVYEPNASNASKGLLSFEGFMRYLMSDDNIIVPLDKVDLSDDMTQPLCHYFINSSHNTYLTGHQLTGRSSVEMYRQCLLAGCRCIELDFWNGRTDEPVIYHGFTLVPEILAKDVISAIAESAFKTSDWPVILSFENHCNQKQQAKIAQYCRDIFGDMLLSAPLDNYPLEANYNLPPPSELRRKILIKNKKKHRERRCHDNASKARLQMSQRQSTFHVSIDESVPDTDPIPSEVVFESGDIPATSNSAVLVVASDNSDVVPALAPSSGENIVVDEPVVTCSSSTTDEEDGDDEEDEEDSSASSTTAVTAVGGGGDECKKEGRQEERRTRLSHSAGVKETGTAGRESEAGAELSALVIYVQPAQFLSFAESERRKRCYEMSSFVETQATALLKTCPVDFVNYNKQQLSRIYPKGTRVDSHNYMPQVFWNAGCQLVALNYQTLDLSMQLNIGIFEYNNRSGYLLKPDFMCRPDRRFDPFAESTVDGIIAGTVSIKVISGQFLSDKRVGVYVEVDMYGLPADTMRRRFRTRVIQNNAINPVWDEPAFVFKKVVLPDLACIRVAAYEESGRLLGHRVLPVVGLRPGYRHISLRNEFGLPLTLCTIFVKISVGDYVPLDLSNFADALANPIKYQSELEKRAQQLKVLTDEDGASLAGASGDDAEGDEEFVVSSAGVVSSNANKTTSNTSTVTPVRSGSSSIEPPTVSGGLLVFGGEAAERNAGAGISSMRDSVTDTTPSPRRSESMRAGATPTSSSVRRTHHDVSIPSELTTAETIDTLWQDKLVKDKRCELDKKLDALLRKHSKECGRLMTVDSASSSSSSSSCTLSLSSPAPHSVLSGSPQQLSVTATVATPGGGTAEARKTGAFVKTHALITKTFSNKQLYEAGRTVAGCPASAANADSMLNVYSQIAASERDIFDKYIVLVYDCLDKAVRGSQTAQLKRLHAFYDKKVGDSRKKIENDAKDACKKLSKKGVSKDEMSRLKREERQTIIRDGVEMRAKLNDRFQQAVETLSLQHLQVRQQSASWRQAAQLNLSTYVDVRVASLTRQGPWACRPSVLLASSTANASL